MITPCRLGATRHLRHAPAVVSFASSGGSRTAAYRHLSTQRAIPSTRHPSSAQRCFTQSILLPQSPLRPPIFPISPQFRFPFTRLLHTSSPQFQQPRPAEDIKDPPREDHRAEPKTGQSGKDEPKADEAKDETSEDDSSHSKKESKKDEPPPPPHGDKSPWQVFTETLRSEFKASKEWNESTKQLASSAHQFSESESVKRARAAYDATAGAATSKTAEALKTTGKALGQGAAWTWDTKMVQGIRGGVNATGRGIEKATRPVRETKTFQSIKEVVDDGSSSRYGGWVEKEERRKKKELRELKEVESGRRLSGKMEEDPKYDDPYLYTHFC
jgi:mitochondrial import inner membrane translocase subunit TIM44